MSRDRLTIALVLLAFFVLSLLSNILGPIVPDIIIGFHASLAAAAFLPFSFFIAYAAFSIPAGSLVERAGDKAVMAGSFALAAMGAFVFALFPRYPVAVLSLFVMGAGMASLQVVINPLLRVAGGEEHFAFNSALAQFLFGLASFLAPQVYAYFAAAPGGSGNPPALRRLMGALTPPAMPWMAMYWIFAALTGIMVLLTASAPLPRVERRADEKAGTLAMYKDLLREPAVWFYFVAIFAYVGSEQGTADWISEFLFRYHGIDPHSGGAMAVAWFWGLLTAGCFVGMILLKFFDSRRVLIGFSLGALTALSAALWGSRAVALAAFPLVGLFASIMWPTVISLALNSVDRYHGSLTGILCTGIAGGAICPLIIGRLGDRFGLRGGMMLLYLTFGVVASVGFWARPLVNNETLRTRKARPGEPIATG